MEEEKSHKEFTNRESKICIVRDQIEHLIKMVYNHNGIHLDLANTTKQKLKGPYWCLSISKNINHSITWECPKFEDKVIIEAQRGAIITTNPQEDWPTSFIDYLTHGTWTTPAMVPQKQQIAIRSRPFHLINGE